MIGCGGRSLRSDTAPVSAETVAAPAGTVPAAPRGASTEPPELIITDPSDSDCIEVSVEAALFESVTPPPYTSAQGSSSELYRDILKSHIPPLRTPSSTSVKAVTPKDAENLEVPRSPSTVPPAGTD